MPRPKPRLAVAREPEPASPRDILRARLGDLAAADAAVARAEQLIEAGQANLEAMQAKADAGADTERQVRAHRVQALKAGRSGDEDLPEVIELARAAARRAKDGLADAKAVLVDLNAELADAQAARAEMMKPVELAAQEVIRTEDAPRLAAELQAATTLRDRLHRELEALSTIQVRHGFVGYIPGVPEDAPFYRYSGPIMLGPDVPAALNPRPGWETMTQDQIRAVSAAWGGYMAALQRDADATPPA